MHPTHTREKPISHHATANLHTIVCTDSGQDAYSLTSPAVAEAIRSYPTDGFDNGTTHLVEYLPNETATAADATYSSGVPRSELDEYPVVLGDSPQ